MTKSEASLNSYKRENSLDIKEAATYVLNSSMKCKRKSGRKAHLKQSKERCVRSTI